jgi:hypothetical protein
MRQPAAPKADDLVVLAQDIADIMADDPGLMAEGMPHLVTALRALAATDEALVALVALPPAVHAALELHLTGPEA